MRTVKDIEAYLEKLNRRYTSVEGEPGTFLIHSSAAQPAIAVRIDPPLVVLRVHIGDVTSAAKPGTPGAGGADHAALFRKLLQLNAKGLVHASYGLEDDRIVLSSALELENLDFNEIEATLDEIDLALAQQVPELAELSKKN
jgi:hypothetical protein